MPVHIENHMTQPFDEQQQMQRGHDAADLLANPLLAEAFDKLRERLAAELFDSPVRDKEGREHLWMMRKLLDAVQSNLTTLVQTGELISMERERKRSMVERLKDWATD